MARQQHCLAFDRDPGKAFKRQINEKWAGWLKMPFSPCRTSLETRDESWPIRCAAGQKPSTRLKTESTNGRPFYYRAACGRRLLICVLILRRHKIAPAWKRIWRTCKNMAKRNSVLAQLPAVCRPVLVPSSQNV